MNGGTFDYKQGFIKDIIEDIQEVLDGDEYYEGIRFVMREGIHSLKRTYILVNNIDLFLSGNIDDNELYRRIFIESGGLEYDLETNDDE